MIALFMFGKNIIGLVSYDGDGFGLIYCGI